MRRPFSLVMPYRDRKGFRLDTLGMEVWQACDGTRTIENIVEEFSDRHRSSFHEARLAVTQFIKTMASRELVAVVLEKPGRRPDEID